MLQRLRRWRQPEPAVRPRQPYNSASGRWVNNRQCAKVHKMQNASLVGPVFREDVGCFFWALPRPGCFRTN